MSNHPHNPMLPKLHNITLLFLTAGVATSLTVGAEETESQTLFYRPLTLSAEAGYSGLGGSVHWRFSDHLGIGAGFNGLGLSFDYDEEGVEFDAKIKLLAAPVTLDVYPSKKRSFRISAGVALNGNEITSDSTFSEDQEIGNNTYTPAEIGTLSLDVELGDEVVPYVSLGGVLFYFDKAHRWSLSGEVGVMITGSPKVVLDSSNSGGNPALAADLEIERQDIEDDLDAFKIWPVAKLAVSFSF